MNNDEVKYYRTNKYGDWLLDNIPYAWRVYYKYLDIKQWVVSVYQKTRYGVSDTECWSLDVTLTKLILPKLKHFKKMKRFAHPPDLTEEEWESVLDEIIWTFEYMKTDGDNINPFPILNKKGEDLKEYFNREKTPDEKILLNKWLERNKEFDVRKQKGLELFAKYYCHLWD